jgi:hypothetical protein
MSGTNIDARLGGATFTSALGVANALGGQMNIPELMMAIQIERGNIIDGQIRDQMAEMQKRNEWLRDANAALAAMRANRPTNDKDVKDYGTFINSKGETQSVMDFFDKNGIAIEHTGNDEKGVQTEFDQAIANLKSAIDTVNSQSQMDMVRLQGLMDKRNQTFDMITNSLSKFSKSMDSVISNMR